MIKKIVFWRDLIIFVRNFHLILFLWLWRFIWTFVLLFIIRIQHVFHRFLLIGVINFLYLLLFLILFPFWFFLSPYNYLLAGRVLIIIIDEFKVCLFYFSTIVHFIVVVVMVDSILTLNLVCSCPTVIMGASFSDHELIGKRSNKHISVIGVLLVLFAADGVDVLVEVDQIFLSAEG